MYLISTITRIRGKSNKNNWRGGNGYEWLTPVVLATWEAEPRQKVSEAPSQPVAGAQWHLPDIPAMARSIK
jgi:hypothetical protein